MVRLEPLVLVEEPDYDDDDYNSPWYGCRTDGCCVDEEWWAATMPPRAFLQDGLVHMSTRWDGTQSYCGTRAVPYGVQLYSTDAAKAYAAQLSEEATEVTCFTCIAYDFELAPRGRWR